MYIYPGNKTIYGKLFQDNFRMSDKMHQIIYGIQCSKASVEANPPVLLHGLD